MPVTPQFGGDRTRPATRFPNPVRQQFDAQKRPHDERRRLVQVDGAAMVAALIGATHNWSCPASTKIRAKITAIKAKEAAKETGMAIAHHSSEWASHPQLMTAVPDYA